MAYTYDDFTRSAKELGLYDHFSQADLQLAMQNPDAGMSILKYKQDFLKATSEEERALANAGAEGIRSSYGGYTGGADGGSFRLDPMSPRSFSYDSAPGYAGSAYDKDLKGLYEQQVGYGDYRYDKPAPSYNNQYRGRIDAMTDAIVNRGPFSYNPETDPLYGSYQKTYKREGDRATAQALAEAAGATGGRPSSYAISAAAQAGNYYAGKMADKLPELQQLAYSQYLNDFSMDQGKLEALQALEQGEYAKYRDQLAQYNTDRSFDYGVWADGYNRAAANVQTAQALAEQEYNRYLNDLAQKNAERDFAYGQHIDELNSQAAKREEELNKAILGAQYGDYSGLERQGITVDPAALAAGNAAGGQSYSDLYDMAQTAAKYGDPSLLEQLGVKVSYAPGSQFGIPSDEYMMLIAEYPNGIITDRAYYDRMLSMYGANAMAAAGLSRPYQQAEGIPQNGRPDASQTAAGQGYTAASNQIAVMLRDGQGFTVEDVSEMLGEYLAYGYITKEQYDALLQQARVTAMTGRAQRNYTVQ